MKKIDLRMKTYHKDNITDCKYCNGIGYTWDNYGEGEMTVKCPHCSGMGEIYSTYGEFYYDCEKCSGKIVKQHVERVNWTKLEESDKPTLIKRNEDFFNHKKIIEDEIIASNKIEGIDLEDPKEKK